MNLIGIVFLLVSLTVSQIFRSRIASYSRIWLRADISGAEAAHKILHEYGIDDVVVTFTRGHLTDHYNPLNKTVNLSAQVYHGKSAAAVAIAAHECGHAIQHAQGYAFLRLRSAMVPLLSATTRVMPWVILLGIFLINTTLLPLEIGIALFALTTLFSLVNLPVEFDASRRALAWMDSQRVITTQERQIAKDALWWAAMTYVVAALGSLVQLLHLFSILQRTRE